MISVVASFGSATGAFTRGKLLSYARSVLPLMVLAAIWQLASLVSPPFLFPGLQSIAGDIWEIVTSWDLLSQGLVTWARIIGAVALSLLIGVPIGLLMGISKPVDEFCRPVVKFIMAFRR